MPAVCHQRQPQNLESAIGSRRHFYIGSPYLVAVLTVLTCRARPSTNNYTKDCNQGAISTGRKPSVLPVQFRYYSYRTTSNSARTKHRGWLCGQDPPHRDRRRPLQSTAATTTATSTATACSTLHGHRDRPLLRPPHARSEAIVAYQGRPGRGKLKIPLPGILPGRQVGPPSMNYLLA